MEETALKRRLVVDLARPLKPKLTIFPSRKPIKPEVHKFGSKVLKGSSWAVTKARAAVGAKTFSVAEWDNIETAEHVNESMQSLSIAERLNSCW